VRRRHSHARQPRQSDSSRAICAVAIVRDTRYDERLYALCSTCFSSRACLIFIFHFSVCRIRTPEPRNLMTQLRSRDTKVVRPRSTSLLKYLCHRTSNFGSTQSPSYYHCRGLSWPLRCLIFRLSFEPWHRQHSGPKTITLCFLTCVIPGDEGMTYIRKHNAPKPFFLTRVQMQQRWFLLTKETEASRRLLSNRTITIDVLACRVSFFDATFTLRFLYSSNNSCSANSLGLVVSRHKSLSS
jgi:hypothetical protein